LLSTFVTTSKELVAKKQEVNRRFAPIALLRSSSMLPLACVVEVTWVLPDQKARPRLRLIIFFIQTSFKTLTNDQRKQTETEETEEKLQLSANEA
jgi:hypothetical protein